VTSHKMKKIAFKVVLYLAALLLLLYLVLPFLWMIISSISLERELISTARWLPEEPQYARFINIFREEAFFREAFINSIIVTSFSTAITLFVGILAAYAAARFNFKGKQGLLIGVLLTQMLPGATIIIPIYLFMGRLGMRDTRIGLLIVYVGFILPVVIWILKNYFITIPVEIEEAAIIDGANTAQILIKIMIPLVVPAIFATGLFSLITVWNEFFFALILTSIHSRTVPVAATQFSTMGGVDYSMMATAGVIGAIVPITIAFIFRDLIIEGLTAGWSK